VKTVSGIYHDASRVTDAVRALLGESVPAESIGVEIHDEAGRRLRVKVSDEAGVVEGAVQGASIGAALGGLIMFIAAFAMGAGTEGGFLPVGPFAAAISGALGGGAAGVMLGAIVGMGRWKGMPDLDPEVLANGSVVVSVRSDALADKARRILAESGAEDVRIRAEGDLGS
jgi:hypothetical protein